VWVAWLVEPWRRAIGSDIKEHGVVAAGILAGRVTRVVGKQEGSGGCCECFFSAQSVWEGEMGFGGKAAATATRVVRWVENKRQF
jgi:hypothetical protein